MLACAYYHQFLENFVLPKEIRLTTPDDDIENIFPLEESKYTNIRTYLNKSNHSSNMFLIQKSAHI